MRATGRDLVGETRLALKTAVAASLGWWLGTAAGEPRPIFATLVGLVAMSGGPANALNVSVARILGQARRALRLKPLRRRHVEELELLAFRINFAARLYRHARSIARDVADTRIVDHDLVAAAPAGAALAVHAQLRQMLDDLRAVAFR